MTKIPAHAPSHVAAGERVKGLFIAQAPIPKGSPNYKRLEILDSEHDASEFASKGYVQAKSVAGAQFKQCVFSTDESTGPGDAWPALARGEIATYPGSSQNPVLGVHIETLEDGSSDKSASLGIVDAWLDTRTRGFKLITRTTVPLEVVSEGPFGIRVLAARSDDSVNFVVVPPVPDSNDKTGFAGQFDRGIIESGGEIGASQCRHSRLTLHALPGTGERAVVSFQHVEQAPHEPADGEPTDKESGKNAFLTSRVRVVQVHLSASRNVSGGAPVVSVSFRVDKPKPFGA